LGFATATSTIAIRRESALEFSTFQLGKAVGLKIIHNLPSRRQFFLNAPRFEQRVDLANC
jgi:hypothetical protein